MARTTIFWLLMLLAVTAAARRKKNKVLPKDCSEVTKRKSKVYRINPDGEGAIKVFCDMKTEGGGWTVFQRRVNGKVDFHRMWNDYKKGFGKVGKKSSFWLGNDNLHRLTANREVILRIELKSWDEPHTPYYAMYQKFSVGDEASRYTLKFQKDGYEGTAGNSLNYHYAMPFSTEDIDNDKARRECSEHYGGGWWFNQCFAANLNGEYLDEKNAHPTHSNINIGIRWLRGKSKLAKKSLKFSEMKIKPVE